MEERVFSIIKKVINNESTVMDKNATVTDVMNSISFVEMIILLEDEFNFEFDDDSLIISKFQTIGDIIDYVSSKSNN